MRIVRDGVDTQGLTPEEHGFVCTDVLLPEVEGDLTGWNIPAKDLAPVEGLPMSLGSIHRTLMPDSTDPAIRALRARGATIYGKTQTSELGLTAYCEPNGMPAPMNPRFPGATTGGSSGGAAVAVARGLVRAAHGTDGGGSIRVPAAACGVYGLKLAHNNQGAVPTGHGFLARSLDDLEILIGARHESGPTSRSVRQEIPASRSVRQEIPASRSVRRDLRVGYITEPLHAEVEPDPRAIDETVRVARALGGHFVARPYPISHFDSFATVFAYRATRIHGPLQPIGEWLRETGQAVTSAQYVRAAEDFMATEQMVDALDVDVLVMPVLAYEPPPIGYFSSLAPWDDFAEQTRWTPWATLANMGGYPALTLPIGLGVQLVGVHATAEDLLLLARGVAPTP
ncbi:MAG: amidase family protein [Corynebacterium pyruviciproducens]|uniref:amidase family protein n=1 Tax=Corynebacterium pyruviciproducens TaxID=598660 RepID=UPI0021509C35|nr:amidase [Corynebacterium pyruviciproducens]